MIFIQKVSKVMPSIYLYVDLLMFKACAALTFRKIVAGANVFVHTSHLNQ